MSLISHKALAIVIASFSKPLGYIPTLLGSIGRFQEYSGAVVFNLFEIKVSLYNLCGLNGTQLKK